MKYAEWRDARAKEIQALESNNAWSLCSIPKGKSPIGYKWAYKIKYWYVGSIERYKAHLLPKVILKLKASIIMITLYLWLN